MIVWVLSISFGCNMRRTTFKDFLTEAPIGDYETFGNWDKNSSFRDPRDRTLVRNPTTIERVRKKFENTPYTFNFYFVNSPQANRVTEVGEVDMSFIRQRLGDEVHDAVQKNMDNDGINIVFTNNKGAERKNMTAWIIAHRIGHALARSNYSRSNQYYLQVSDFLISSTSTLLGFYGVQGFPESEKELNRETSRAQQLTMLHLFHELATFRSAREKKIRDWFEVLNELIAQYLTTGRIKFNPPPKTFGPRGRQRHLKQDDREDAEHFVEMLASDLEMMIDDILSASMNKVFVM